jgi:predicted small lipoprotein YifL
VQWFLLMEGLFALMSLTRCGQKTGWNFLSN